MAALVVKEHMRLEDVQNSVFFHAAQEEHFVRIYAPVFQCCDYTFMSRSTVPAGYS